MNCSFKVSKNSKLSGFGGVNEFSHFLIDFSSVFAQFYTGCDRSTLYLPRRTKWGRFGLLMQSNFFKEVFPHATLRLGDPKPTIPRLPFPTTCTHPTFRGTWAHPETERGRLMHLRHFLWKSFVPNGQRPRDDTIVIRRMSGRSRPVSDSFYDDATKALSGAIVVELEGKSVREQTSIFWNAKHVVAVHGAGMSNLVSCRPGTHVLEVQPKHATIPVPEEYNQLSMSLGLHYRRTREIVFALAWDEAHSDKGHSTPPQLDKNCRDVYQNAKPGSSVANALNADYFRSTPQTVA